MLSLQRTLAMATLLSLASAGPGMRGRMAALMAPKDFFLASGPEDDCGTVPADVMMGNPMMMACMERENDAEVCVCVKHAQLPPLPLPMRPVIDVNADTGYMRVCGKCTDPCNLEFVPNKKPALAIGAQIKDMLGNIVKSMFNKMDEDDD